MHIYPINGACHRVAADATAFAYRDAKFATVIAGMWPDPADNEKNTKWVKDYYAALQPHSAAGGYVNFMAERRPGPHPRQLQGELRPAGRDQEEVRPGEPVPREPEHQAGLNRRHGGSVKADELRALQAPLKEQYRAEPAAALVTLKAEGRLGEGVTCSVATGRALVEAGLHSSTGGTGTSACSGDMLLQALAACAGVTLGAVATSLGIELHAGVVRAEGDLDFRGTLGVAKEVPVGIQRIRLRFELDTDASEEQLATLQRLTERYCVVYQTLRNPPAIEVSRAAVAE